MFEKDDYYYNQVQLKRFLRDYNFRSFESTYLTESGCFYLVGVVPEAFRVRATFELDISKAVALNDKRGRWEVPTTLVVELEISDYFGTSGESFDLYADQVSEIRDAIDELHQRFGSKCPKVLVSGLSGDLAGEIGFLWEDDYLNFISKGLTFTKKQRAERTLKILRKLPLSPLHKSKLPYVGHWVTRSNLVSGTYQLKRGRKVTRVRVNEVGGVYLV